MSDPSFDCELTILMPCLNEAETLETCITKAAAFLKRSGIVGEILIADNGSDDGSQAIATRNGGRVVDVPIKGYGVALITGIQAARGRYVIMGDSDDSYDFTRLELFIEKLRAGFDLVMGNRFAGGIAPGAMPPLHRYLGNPVLTLIGRLFFGGHCRDFHCGLRGFRRDSIIKLDLQAPGMEFASEMVVKAAMRDFRITEVPTTLSPDGRSRPPHLNTWSDGWRHLRFLMLFCPRWLFLYPGFFLLSAGLLGIGWLVPEPRRMGTVVFDIHTLYYSGLSALVGTQLIFFWVFSKIYCIREGFLPSDAKFSAFMKWVTLEAGLAVSAMLMLLGVGLAVYALHTWGAGEFGPISPSTTMRFVIPSGVAIMLAFQIASGAFFISVLEIRSRFELRGLVENAKEQAR
jgi:glycosyltransferase involved in cell wall biosynthesis